MRFWFVIHNLIAHPLMVVLPRAWGNALHDWTAMRAFPATDGSSASGNEQKGKAT